MAVDVKSLRIGSHISINGERVEVESLQGGDMVGYITPDNDWFATESWRFEPINITPALLDELGFEEDKTDIAKRVGGYYIYFHQINNLRWRVSLEEENCTNYGNCIVRYLHEAESFLALHNIELMEE